MFEHPVLLLDRTQALPAEEDPQQMGNSKQARQPEEQNGRDSTQLQPRRGEQQRVEWDRCGEIPWHE